MLERNDYDMPIYVQLHNLFFSPRNVKLTFVFAEQHSLHMFSILCWLAQ